MLYLELMEQMNKPMMDKHLASTTFKYIKILLRSDRIKTQVPCSLMPAHTAYSCLDMYVCGQDMSVICKVMHEGIGSISVHCLR